MSITRSDAEIGLIMKLPGVGRRLLLAVGRFADAFGLLPRSFIDADPLYATAFFANLGSIGQDAGYHHLYEYGTIGVFGVLGRPTSEPGSPTSGPDRRRTMSLRWTFDERVEDGLVAGYGLRLASNSRGSGRRRAFADRLVAGPARPGWFPVDSRAYR